MSWPFQTVGSLLCTRTAEVFCFIFYGYIGEFILHSGESSLNCKMWLQSAVPLNKSPVFLWKSNPGKKLQEQDCRQATFIHSEQKHELVYLHQTGAFFMLNLDIEQVLVSFTLDLWNWDLLLNKTQFEFMNKQKSGVSWCIKLELLPKTVVI